MHAQINCRLPCSVVRAKSNFISHKDHARVPVTFLANSEWHKPGSTALTIRDLSRSLSLSPRAKKMLSTIEMTKISVYSYMSKDKLTFAIPISARGFNPDFFVYIFISRKEMILLTPNIQVSQISQDHWENRKHPCLSWSGSGLRSKQRLSLELSGAFRRFEALLEVDEEREGKCTSC
jgi:hypothetical protein